MTVCVGIDGFGRIGHQVLKAYRDHERSIALSYAAPVEGKTT
jgi:glyceraldehyde-3-phosphate dehydrogenase/erythrose-4-phosphate dehydrogenase